MDKQSWSWYGGFSHFTRKNVRLISMKRTAGIILFLSLMACCHSREAHSSASQVQTFVSNRNTMSPMFVQHTTNPSAVHMQDSTKVIILDSLKLKDPYMALFYAVVPGLVLHGAGHVYAGRIPTAITLFGGELIGAGLVFLGGVSQIEGPNDQGENAMFIGSVVFVGTWLYDFIGSPLAVSSHNRRMLDQKAVGLELRMKDKEPRVAVVWRF
jgi:hypothetical protein